MRQDRLVAGLEASSPPRHGGELGHLLPLQENLCVAQPLLGLQASLLLQRYMPDFGMEEAQEDMRPAAAAEAPGNSARNISC